VPTESGTVVVAAAAAAAAAAICANLLHAGYNISLTKTAISAWGKDRKEQLKTTKATEEGIQQDCLYQSERRMTEKANGRRPGGREVKSWQWLATKGF
jgi:hypothetical protein